MNGRDRFGQALLWAHELHRGQVRKGSATPYIGHLLAAASLVLDHGGDEDQAIAGLLHDAMEDQGVTAAEIAERFGERVAIIVTACTDGSLGEARDATTWRSRKERYLDHLEVEAPLDALLVSAADKLHNARTIVADLRVEGWPTLERFSGGSEGTLWYYRSLARVLARRLPGELTDELHRVVDDMRRLAVRGD